MQNLLIEGLIKIVTLFCRSFFAQNTVAITHRSVLETKGFLKKVKTKEFY